MNDNLDDDNHDDNYGVDVDHTSGSYKYQISCHAMESLQTVGMKIKMTKMMKLMVWVFGKFDLRIYIISYFFF